MVEQERGSWAMTMRIYLGLGDSGAREIFRAPTLPTFASHGHAYFAVIGPFKTLRGAEFMRNYGCGNPHLRTVADAERLGEQIK
jgi:hypothetical protein